MNWIILVLLSALFLSFRAIISKNALKSDHSVPLLFLTSVIGSFFMLGFAQHIEKLTLITFTATALKALVISIGWVSFYRAIKHLDISIVSPLRALSPIIVVLISMTFLGEQLTLLQLFSIALLVFAAYLLELDTLTKFKKPLKLFKSKSFMYIMISVVANAISAVIDKVALQHTNIYTLSFYFYAFLSLLYAIYLITNRKWDQIYHTLRHSYYALFFIPFFLITSDLLYLAAVAIPGSLIALIIPIRRLEALFSVIIGGNIFHEHHLLHKSAATLIMIIGVFLLVL